MKTSNNIFNRLFSYCIFLIPSLSFGANIIFDMDGVLVSKSRLSACYNIGLTNFFGFYNPLTIEKKLFDFLDLLEPRHPKTPGAMYKDRLLPQIMCDWLSGLKTNEEVREIIIKGLVTHDSFFATNSEKNLITAMLDFMFTPEKFIKAMHPVRDTGKLVKKLIKQTDKNGNKNRLFILTNWDIESFNLLYKNKKMRKLFSRFDGIMVSGSVKSMKPDTEIYEKLCTTFNIDPENELTFFIDDMRPNVQAAEKVGIDGIQCKKLNIKAVRKKLKNLGAY